MAHKTHSGSLQPVIKAAPPPAPLPPLQTSFVPLLLHPCSRQGEPCAGPRISILFHTHSLLLNLFLLPKMLFLAAPFSVCLVNKHLLILAGSTKTPPPDSQWQLSLSSVPYWAPFLLFHYLWETLYNTACPVSWLQASWLNPLSLSVLVVKWW